MTPKVLSVGAGAAFDVRVSLTLEHGEPSGDYVAAVLRPGRGQALLFRDPASQQVMVTVDEISQFERLHLTGYCRDAMRYRSEEAAEGWTVRPESALGIP